MASLHSLIGLSLLALAQTAPVTRLPGHALSQVPFAVQRASLSTNGGQPARTAGFTLTPSATAPQVTGDVIDSSPVGQSTVTSLDFSVPADPPSVGVSSLAQSNFSAATTSLSVNVSRSSTSPTAAATSTGSTLKLSLKNNLGSDNAHVYVSGIDRNGQVVMLTTSGDYYHPNAAGSTTPQSITADIAIPLGPSTQLILPDYISSARVWFSVGTLSFSVVSTANGPGLVEPSAVNPSDPDATVDWGFIELTFTASYGLYANLSFVDFVGLPLGMQLQQLSGNLQAARGLPHDAVSRLCKKLTHQQSVDGQPWDSLCVSRGNTVLRVVSPATYLTQEQDAFADYWDHYLDAVWSKYTRETLIINTQSSSGNVSCTSDGSTLNCDGDNRAYSKPSALDIFGCNSGPFTVLESDNDVHQAVVPRLCAAIHRATLKSPGGELQPSLPPRDYYRTHPNNWYSAFVHEIELDGRGYAFAYDDVSPSAGLDVSGSVSAPDPETLTIYVGGSS